MVSFNIPSRNEDSYEELAAKYFGTAGDVEVELTTMKILVSALSVLLLDKGVCSRKEMQTYIENALQMYTVLKKIDDQK